jgi:hypothetical protein
MGEESGTEGPRADREAGAADGSRLRATELSRDGRSTACVGAAGAGACVGTCELGPKGAGQAGEEDRFVVTASGFRVREGFLVNLIILSPLCNSIVSRGFLFEGRRWKEARSGIKIGNQLEISIDRRKPFHMKGS